MQNRPRQGAPRRMTRQQYEALQRQRRQNKIAIAVIAGIAILIVTAVVLILRPHGTPDAVTAISDVAPDAPVATAQAQPLATAANPGGVDLAAQIAGEDGSTSQAEAPADVAAQPEAAAEPTPVPAIPQAVDSVVSTPRPDGALRRSSGGSGIPTQTPSPR